MADDDESITMPAAALRDCDAECEDLRQRIRELVRQLAAEKLTALRNAAMLILANGGEIRVPKNLIVAYAPDRTSLSTFVDHERQEVVYRADVEKPQTLDATARSL